MKIKRIAFFTACIMLVAASCKGPLGGQSVLAGVAKTTNGGNDWTLTNTVVTTTGTGKKTKITHTEALANNDVQALVMEPNSSERIFAAATTGVFYTEDGGESWKQILSKMQVNGIVLDHGNSDHVYAAGVVGGNGKVLETKDKGKSWEEVYNEVTAQNPVNAIVINPDNAREVVIGLQSGNVIKSSDSGQSWTLAQNFQDAVLQIVWQRRGLYVLTKTRGLYKSMDGANNFTNVSSGLITFTEQRGRASARPGETELPNADLPPETLSAFHGFAVSPRNSTLVYVAANNGLFKSTDEGRSWTYLRLPLKSNTSSNLVPISTVALGSSDSTVFASAANTVYKSVNAGNSWQVQSIATTARIQYILIDSKVSQIAYVGLDGGN